MALSLPRLLCSACRHRRRRERGGGEKRKNCCNGTTAFGLARSAFRCSLLSPLWRTPPPRRAPRARRGKRATRGRKGEGAPSPRLPAAGEDTRCPFAPFSSTAVVVADAQRRSRSKWRGDPSRCPPFRAPCCHVQLVPRARRPRCGAPACLRRLGRSRGRTEEEDTGELDASRAVGAAFDGSIDRFSILLFFFFAAEQRKKKRSSSPAYHQNAHLALRKETGEQLREGEAHGGRCLGKGKKRTRKERRSERERGKTRKREGESGSRRGKKTSLFFFSFSSLSCSIPLFLALSCAPCRASLSLFVL